MEQTVETKLKTRIEQYQFVMAILVILLLIISGLAYYFYSTNIRIQGFEKIDSGDMVTFRQSLAQLVNESPLEHPDIITIVDINELQKKNAVLYSQAQNDDLVIIYKDKTIVYRPSTSQIITVFPLTNSKQ